MRLIRTLMTSCPACGGSGTEQESRGAYACLHCDGSGTVPATCLDCAQPATELVWFDDEPLFLCKTHAQARSAS